MNASTDVSHSLDPTLANRKVLQDQDLLALIFSNLVEYKLDFPLKLGLGCVPRTGLADLFQVGLTCRAFVEPALNHLWHEMNSFLPLLHLIPKVIKIGGVYTSSSVILPTDLQTFQSYSSRIRHIHLFSFKERISNHIYSSVTRHLFDGNSGLFPALRCFALPYFQDIPKENLLLLPLITSSYLSTITIRDITTASEIHLASFLYGIAHMHSSSSMIYPLSFLHLEGWFTMSTLSQLDYFKKLTTLELFFKGTYFPLVALSSLSKLPSLSTLVLFMLPKDDNGRLILDAKSPPKLRMYSFSNLRQLILKGNDIEVPNILQSIHGEQLLKVELALGIYSTTNILKACIARCLEMGPHILYFSMHVLGSPAHIRLPPDLFRPIPNNSAQLRSFLINSVTIPLEHFRDLFDYRVGLWPALKSLVLRVSGDSADLQANWLGIDEVVPLSSLSMLVASCPRLHTLDLYLYYPLGEGYRETEVLTTYIQSLQPTDHGLADLKIKFLDPFVTVPLPGNIVDAITVSRFIDHLFPNLQSFDISDTVGDVRKEWYCGIKAMMENYRDVRERKPIRKPIISN